MNTNINVHNLSSFSAPSSVEKKPASSKNDQLQKKEDSRISTISQILTSETGTFIDPLNVCPAEKDKVINDIMNLRKPESATIQHDLNIKLNLDVKDLELLNVIFLNWALHDHICLIDLWGLDVFVLLEKLNKYFVDKDWVGDFSCNFLSGYISSIVDNNLKNFEEELSFKPIFFDRSKIQRGTISFISGKELILKLKDLNSELRASMNSRKGKIKIVNNIIRESIKRLELGIKLLQHPQSYYFLCEYNLSGLRRYFPNSIKLNSSNATKTIEDLTTLLRFLSFTNSEAVKRKILGIDDNFFSIFQNKVEIFSKSKNKLKAIKLLKIDLSQAFVAFQKKQDFVETCCIRAFNGELTPEKYYGSRLSCKKTQQEFSSQMLLNQVHTSLNNDFAEDCLRILDYQVMMLLYPDSYVTLDAGLNRFKFNLSYVINRYGDILQSEKDNAKVFPKMDLPAYPTPLTSDQEKLLKNITNKIQRDNISLICNALLESLDLDILIKWKNISEIDDCRFSTWFPFIRSLEPILKSLNEFLKNLDMLRVSHLKLIKNFYKSFEKEDLKKNHSEWTQFFKDVCFSQSLEICRFSMMAQDLKMLLNNQSIFSDVDTEEDLLSNELVDYMELEGIQKIIDKLVPNKSPEIPSPSSINEEATIDPPQLPPSETTATPSSPSPILPEKESVTEKEPNKDIQNKVQPPVAQIIKAVEPKKPAPSEEKNKEQESEEISPFKIRRGEKTRKVLNRLREIGFLPPKNHRGGTSHFKLELNEGKQTIVPKGGKRVQIKAGTAKSIEKQVNEAVRFQ